MTPEADRSGDDRLFIHVAATGIAYCDRGRTVDGDYARIGFLPFSTLDPEIDRECGEPLRGRIHAHMEAMQARRGESFEISTAGQVVTLGHATMRGARNAA